VQGFEGNFPELLVHSKGFRDLPVWERAVDLADEVYALSRSFPQAERFGITSQLRRAAVSVSSNIAEGSGRGTTPDLGRFLSYSRGSVKETESLILVSERLRFASAADVRRTLDLTDELSRMLVGFRRSLSRRKP
jgi:four helix bundle protein